MAEITRQECVGPAPYGGVHHEFVSPPEAAGLDQSSGRASGCEDEVWLNQWITAAIARRSAPSRRRQTSLNAGLEMPRPKTSERSSPRRAARARRRNSRPSSRQAQTRIGTLMIVSFPAGRIVGEIQNRGPFCRHARSGRDRSISVWSGRYQAHGKSPLRPNSERVTPLARISLMRRTAARAFRRLALEPPPRRIENARTRLGKGNRQHPP